jgi:hypothetical protein
VRRREDLLRQTLSKRREILASTVKSHDHVGISQVSSQTATEMLAFVESHGLEVPKRRAAGFTLLVGRCLTSNFRVAHNPFGTTN